MAGSRLCLLPMLSRPTDIFAETMNRQPPLPHFAMYSVALEDFAK